MRLAPVPLFYAADRARAVSLSGESSRPTHAAPAAVDASRYFGALLAGAGTGPEGGASRRRLLQWGARPRGRAGGARFRQAEAPQSSGYVVHTLEAALWALERSKSFREGALLAVNLGGDTDTTGAVFGQLAGALYGEEAIPAEWRAKLVKQERHGRRALRHSLIRLDG